MESVQFVTEKEREKIYLFSQEDDGVIHNKVSIRVNRVVTSQVVQHSSKYSRQACQVLSEGKMHTTTVARELQIKEKKYKASICLKLSLGAMNNGWLGSQVVKSHAKLCVLVAKKVKDVVYMNL